MSKFESIPSIKIGPIRYDLMFVERLLSKTEEKLQGYIEYRPCTLKVEGNSNIQIQAVTILHEILHGLLANAGICKHNEKLIDALAHGLLDVIQDNPKLIKALLELEGSE